MKIESIFRKNARKDGSVFRIELEGQSLICRTLIEKIEELLSEEEYFAE